MTNPTAPAPSTAAPSTAASSVAAPTTPAATVANTQKKQSSTTATTKGSATTKTKKRKKATATTSGGNNNASSSRSTPAASASSILAAASRATKELTDLRTQSEAKKNDVAWLSQNYSKPASFQQQQQQQRHSNTFNESRILNAALKANNLSPNDITKNAYMVLVEHAKRYACELYADAQEYAWHANNQVVSVADLKLAAELRSDFLSHSAMPSMDQLETCAEQINLKPLKPIPPFCYNGVVIPPHSIVRTYDVIPYNEEEEKVPKEENLTKKKTDTPAYGATKGKTIPIKLKEQDKSSTSAN